MAPFTHEPIATWTEVLALAAGPRRLFYKAPLDSHPCGVTVVRVYKNGKLRLSYGDMRFTADSGHLDRFSVRVYTGGPVDPSGNPSQPSPSAVSYTHPADSIDHSDD